MVKGSANPGNRCVQSYRKSKLISKNNKIKFTMTLAIKMKTRKRIKHTIKKNKA